jgi:hypothetical protein
MQEKRKGAIPGFHLASMLESRPKTIGNGPPHVGATAAITDGLIKSFPVARTAIIAAPPPPSANYQLSICSCRDVCIGQAGLVFGGTEGVESHFHVLRAQTHFRRYRGRRVPFSYFALPDSFSAVPRASGHVFIFCAPRLVFNGTEGVGSCFHVLRARTHFRQYRGRRVSFSCFAHLNSFSAVSSASDPFFMLCALGLVFGGTEGVRSRFHCFRSQTTCWRYGGRQVPFLCFALPDSFSAVPSASGPVFKFCAPGLVFGGTEVVDSRFHVLRARTFFRRYRGRQVPFSYFVHEQSCDKNEDCP